MKNYVKMPKSVKLEVMSKQLLDYQTKKYTYRYNATKNGWYRIETIELDTTSALSPKSGLNPGGWVKVELD